MKTVRFHIRDAVKVEPIDRFAKANGTTRAGAHRILELWVERGWIVQRNDGGFDVVKEIPRRDKWTLDQLRAAGIPVT